METWRTQHNNNNNYKSTHTPGPCHSMGLSYTSSAVRYTKEFRLLAETDLNCAENEKTNMRRKGPQQLSLL